MRGLINSDESHMAYCYMKSEKNKIMTNLFLASNSKSTENQTWMDWCKKDILSFLEDNKVPIGSTILFIDFAGKNIEALGDIPKEAYKMYVNMARKTFPQYTFVSAGEESLRLLGQTNQERTNFWSSLMGSVDAVMCAGGNTWTLSRDLWNSALMMPLKKAVLLGLPYIGWSAGSNIVAPLILTTNDMCTYVVTDENWCRGMDLIEFQICPHFKDGNPTGTGGETQEDRLNEFRQANLGTTILAMREGVWLKMQNNELSIGGTNEKALRLWEPMKRPYNMTQEEYSEKFQN